MRRCKRCREVKDNSEFINNKGAECGECKRCREKRKEYRDKNKESIKEKGKLYQSLHRSAINARGKIYEEQHKEEIRERKKNYYRQRKEYIKERERIYRDNNKEKIQLKNAKRLRSEAKYATFSAGLSYIEDPQLGKKGRLLARCYVCGELFVPTVLAATNRVRSLKGEREGESFLYCSEKCQNKCVEYNKGANLPPPKNTRSEKWAKQVKERDKYVCQHCGTTKKLEAHHKVPVGDDPKLAGEISNGITLCDKCHRKVHQNEGLKLHQIQKRSHAKRIAEHFVKNNK